MGGIIRKAKVKVKGFFNQSKKLVQTPKELPDLATQAPPPPPNLQKQQQKEHLQPPPPIKQQSPRKELKLPQIEPPEPIQTPQQRDVRIHEDDMKEFEEAINNINIDVVHNEAPTASTSTPGPSNEEKEEYYKPAELGEGYFSEIEHYIQNKNVKEIIDDIIKKDFLTSMKDYHDKKAQGKPFYLNKHDLEHKLKKKMKQLRAQEEEWHSLNAQIEGKEKKKKEIEQKIDQESQELKELFRQIKINQILEQKAPKEHRFKLRNGQELKSLNDLRKALEYMTEDEYNHHVNQDKNDFANWIKQAMQNHEIYEKIKNIKNKEKLQEILKNPI